MTNASNGIGSIFVAGGPVGLTFDPANGYVYVTDVLGSRLTAINGSTSAVVSNVTVGTYPESVAFDRYNGYLYVANSGSDNVSEVNGSSGQVVGSIPLSVSPTRIVFDPANGNLYVTSDPAGNVTIIRTTGGHVIGSVTVGTFPVGAAFDSSNGDIYVANFGSDNVSVISGATNSIVASVGVGGEPEAVAYDPSHGEVDAANFKSSNVTLINDSTNLTVGSVDVGQPGSEADTFDAVNGFVYDAILPYSGGNGNLTWFNGSTGTVVGSATVGVNPRDVVVDELNGCVFVANSGSNNVSVIPRGYLSAAVAADPFPSEPGVPITFTASASGGYSPYVSYNWTFGDGSTRNGTSSNATYTYTAPGDYVVRVNVTDSQGDLARASLDVRVVRGPTTFTPSATVLSADVGQTATFSVLATGGLPPYSGYHWYGLGAGCPVASGPYVTCTFLSSGNLSITATVTDRLGGVSPPSPALSFTVDPDVEVGAPTANRSSADVGQAIEFRTAATFGSGGYFYIWRGLPPGCPGENATVDCHPASAGTFSVGVNVTDSSGGPTGASPLLQIAIFSDPTVAWSVRRSAIDAGQNLWLNATAGLGSGGYTFTWSGLPAACPEVGAQVECAPTTGSYSVSAVASDSNGFVKRSEARVITVNPDLSLTTPKISGLLAPGSEIRFSVAPSGGTAPVNESWAFGDGSGGSGPSPAHTYAAPGNYSVTVWANDSSGESAVRSILVKVLAPAPTPAGSGGSFDIEGPVIAAAGVVAVLASAILLILRPGRRRSPGPPAPEEDGGRDG